jgi:hypothetical protein
MTDGLGEAVGLNYVAEHDRATLIAYLMAIDEKDYFERGMEMAIADDRLPFRPLDIAQYRCVETDRAEGLERANA